MEGVWVGLGSATDWINGGSENDSESGCMFFQKILQAAESSVCFK